LDQVVPASASRRVVVTISMDRDDRSLPRLVRMPR